MTRLFALCLWGVGIALMALTVACDRSAIDPIGGGAEPAAMAGEQPVALAKAVADPAAHPAGVAKASDWCAGHDIPESMCTVCNPELTAGFKASGDWCAAHGYPESACPFCNPMDPPGSGKAAAGAHAHVHPAGVADPADWCAVHDIPESMCTVCNPELTAGFKASGDWCAAHGYPESACPFCNPMDPPGSGKAAAKTADAPVLPVVVEDWCPGHALPDSMCTKCNPELAAEFKVVGDWCDEHGFPESACPECNPMLPPRLRPAAEGAMELGTAVVAAGTIVRFKSPELEAAVGIQTVPARLGALPQNLEAPARVAFNHDAMAEIRSAVPGIIQEINIVLGQNVTADDTLFALESAAVGGQQARRRALQARLSAARSAYTRQKALRKDAIASQRQVDEAKREYQGAQAELRALDEALRLSGAETRGKEGRFTLRAPISGTIIRRPAVMGSLAGSGDALATIANLKSMWILIDIPEWEAGRVALNQEVVVQIDGVIARAVRGRIRWIASEVDPQTRSVVARAVVANPRRDLRAGQYARATVQIAAPTSSLTVPLSASQRVDAGALLFVRRSEGVYAAVQVGLGRSDGRTIQVRGALSAGDAIVTTGAFLLRTELSPESIGAGCCEAHGNEGN